MVPYWHIKVSTDRDFHLGKYTAAMNGTYWHIKVLPDRDFHLGKYTAAMNGTILAHHRDFHPGKCSSFSTKRPGISCSTSIV